MLKQRDATIENTATNVFTVFEAFPKSGGKKTSQKKPSLANQKQANCYSILIDFSLVKIHYENPYSRGLTFPLFHPH